MSPMPVTNWSGSHRYTATSLHRPETLDELRRLVAEARSLQVLGTRHTFSSIGDAEALVALDRLPDAEAINVDRAAMTVSVGPAVTYAQLAAVLNNHGLALANLASLPHIGVAGAIGTATHGSGDRLGNLATAVRALRLVGGEGDVIDLDTTDPRLAGATVHLGALGVVTQVTLAVVPFYELRQDVFIDLEWSALFSHLDEITAAGRSVSVFHRFGARLREVWVKGDPAQQPGAEGTLFGAIAASAARNPVPGADPANCTGQLGVPGPWSERLPHFRSGFTPSSGEEIQSEWFVARRDGIAAMQVLLELADSIRPLLYVAELRTIAADELWLSPHHGRDSIGLHFTWHREPDAVQAMSAVIEQSLAPLGPRPHWGKFFTVGAGELRGVYRRLDDFRALRDALDPQRTFANDWLNQRVLGVG